MANEARPGAQDAPQLTLNDGSPISTVGFGTFKVDDEIAKDTVLRALDTGYRLIDTARMYGNERGVGAAVRESGISRSDIFVTSKLWNDAQSYDAALAAFEQTFSDLDVAYLDLYLIHWPTPAAGTYVEAWKALEEIAASGQCRSIGVSNFQPEHLDRLAEESGVVPAVNQIEVHPYFAQNDIRVANAERGIVTQAWSPIARGRLLDDQTLWSISAPLDKTPTQVALRWHLQRGDIAIPKSTTPERIIENFDIFDFELSERDMAKIDGLDRNQRLGPHPNEFN